MQGHTKTFFLFPALTKTQITCAGTAWGEMYEKTVSLNIADIRQFSFPAALDERPIDCLLLHAEDFQEGFCLIRNQKLAPVCHSASKSGKGRWHRESLISTGTLILEMKISAFFGNCLLPTFLCRMYTSKKDMLKTLYAVARQIGIHLLRSLLSSGNNGLTLHLELLLLFDDKFLIFAWKDPCEILNIIHVLDEFRLAVYLQIVHQFKRLPD